MRKISLLIALLFLLTFLGGMVLAQKAILQTDCGKFECEEKSAHFEDKYGPGNWTDAGAECICQYYTPEEWELTYCALGTGPPTEEELQMWRDCGVPVPGGPLSGSWGWVGEKEEEYEIHEPAGLTQVTFLGHCADPDWSPDGSQIVFWRKGEDPGLYLINVDGTELKRIGPSGRDPGCDPSWSPVDNRILFHEGRFGKLWSINLDDLVSLNDLSSKVLLTDQLCELTSWSPDGTKIVYNIHPDGTAYSSSIWIMNSDGSGRIPLTTDEDGFCIAPSFSYDGSKIVYLKGFTSWVEGGEENVEPNEVWVMNSDGSNKHMIYAPGDSTQMIFQRAWNKDNKIIFMRNWYHQTGKAPQVWIMNSDGSDPELVASGAALYGDPVWDNGGTRVAIDKVPLPEMALLLFGDVWVFSYEEPAEEVMPEIKEEITEEVEEAPKNIFQKIWDILLNFFNFFKRIFRIE